MAATTFAVLEALGTKPVPSLTDTAIVHGYIRVTTVEGPFKIERNFYQCGNGESFTDNDTFKTVLVHPFAASVAPINSDGGANTYFDATAELEGVETAATFRTVTIRDADSVDDLGIVVTVYGY